VCAYLCRRIAQVLLMYAYVGMLSKISVFAGTIVWIEFLITIDGIPVLASFAVGLLLSTKTDAWRRF